MSDDSERSVRVELVWLRAELDQTKKRCMDLAERNNRYWGIICDAEDIAEDAGRPEGELVTESMAALVKERDEAREAARHIWSEGADECWLVNDECGEKALARWPWLKDET